MAWECFDVKREGGIAHVILNRPAAMNAMNLAFWRELPQVVRQLESEGGTRVAVLSSTGKHFTAGMDLSVFSGARSRARRRRSSANGSDSSWSNCSRPSSRSRTRASP